MRPVNKRLLDILRENNYGVMNSKNKQDFVSLHGVWHKILKEWNITIGDKLVSGIYVCRRQKIVCFFPSQPGLGVSARTMWNELRYLIRMKFGKVY